MLASRFSCNGRWEAKSGETGRIQEHHDAADLFAFHSQDPQGRELIAVFPTFPPIEPESRAAIGTRGQEPQLLIESEDAKPEQSSDIRSSGNPGGKRRHGQPRILSQQRRQARNIRLLPLLSELWARKEATQDMTRIAHISPVAWQHINFYGRYDFTTASEPINMEEIVEALAHHPILSMADEGDA